MSFTFKILSGSDISDPTDYCCICRGLEQDFEYFQLAGVSEKDTFLVLIYKQKELVGNLIFRIIPKQKVIQILLLCSKTEKSGAGSFAVEVLLKNIPPGIEKIILYPETSAIPFYERFGFKLFIDEPIIGTFMLKELLGK